MSTQTMEQPVRLTVVQGGVREVGETELPYAFDLKTLLIALKAETDQMIPSDR